ncbi:MAG: type II toxin-antitoxin system Phd/YefM family antitoxin [Planctomycetia bacterium]
MNIVEIHELRENPLRLLQRIEAGEHLVIDRDGKPMAELRPMASAPAKKRPIGLAAGAFTVADDFDAPLPEEVVREFEGR